MKNSTKWWIFEFVVIWFIIFLIFLFTIITKLPIPLLWWTGIFCYLIIRFTIIPKQK